MRIQIPTTELKTAIVGLSKVVSPRASIPILACVRLDADGKAVTLTGTDLSQVATYEIKCDVPVTAPISALIPLESLQSLLKTTNGPAIEFEVGQDAVTLVGSVSGQNITRRVAMPDPKEWPVLPKPAETKLVETGFLAKFRQAATFASTDAARPLLQAVCLDVGAKSGHKIVATDSRRLTVLDCGHLPLSESAIIPASRFLGWPRLDGDAQIGAGKETFTLRCGPWTFTTKTVVGQYPRWSQVIPSFGKDATVLELSPEDVELLVKALPGMPSFENATDAVVLRLAPNDVRVCSRGNAKAPEAVIRLEKSVCSGAAVSVGLDRRFFRDALLAGFERWQVRDSTSPLVGHTKDDAQACHILMPVRCVNVEAESPNAAAVVAPVQAAKAVPVSVQPQPSHKETTPMKKTEETQAAQTEPSPLDKILVAFETAKNAVRQAQTALGDVAICVRDALREQKAQSREIAEVRAGLAKLQTIRV